MLVSLNEVLKGDGKVMQIQETPELKPISLGNESFPIKCKTPVSLRIRNKGNKELQITGNVEIEVVIPCSRCLEDVSVDMDLQFEKEADMKMSEEERIRALDEQVYIKGYNLDVDKLVYSELLVNWPSKVLCTENCKGICSICGTNLNRKTCKCREDLNSRNKELDPRMAKFQEIFNKFKEV